MWSTVDEKQRWNIAQKDEITEWIVRDTFTKDEIFEFEKKYSKILKSLNKKYKFPKDGKILEVGSSVSCPVRFFPIQEKYAIEPLLEQYKPKDVENVKKNGIIIQKGIGEELPFDDDFFDVTFSRNAIDHMISPAKVMKEMKRVTKKGGLILIAVYTYTDFITWVKETNEKIPFLRDIHHPFTYTPEDFSNLFSQHFKILEEITVFTGKDSLDCGKEGFQGSIMKAPFTHKLAAFVNNKILHNKWFVKEFLVVGRND